MNSLVLKPQLSEKAYALSEALNTYAFIIPKSASSDQVARAVAKQYEVKVASVRVAARGAKPMRAYRGRGRFVDTAKGSIKKAYVTLAEGQSLPLFASDEKSTKKTDKESK